MNQLFTFANQLTLIRLGLIPFFVLSILDGQYTFALALLLAAAVSDGLDGFLARWLKQRTDLGAILDPLADKILISTAFVVLAISGDVEWWVSVIVLGRDVLMILVGSVIVLATGFRIFAPTILGKLCTGAQMVTVFWIVLGQVWPPAQSMKTPLVWLTVALTVASGFHYAARTGKTLP